MLYDHPVSVNPMTHARPFLVASAILGCSAVALAALGAHAFADLLVGPAATRYATAQQMHLLHAPALLGLAVAHHRSAPGWWLAACWLMLIGTLVFCGGLYLAALGVSTALLPIVPAGGSTLMLAWLAAAVGFARGPRSGG
jgi:uncharacterized membrane protein YgdD (TMEM256/DUF423 family)